MINMVYTDEQGNLYDHPSLAACGRSGDQFLPLDSDQVIPIPEGASLVSLPERVAAGWDRRRGGLRFIEQSVTENGRSRIYPVGVLLPQGFTRFLLPGFKRPSNARRSSAVGSAANGADVSTSIDAGAITTSVVPLPLYGYTAVGMRHGRLVVAALQTDEHHKWNPRFFNTPDLKERVSERLADDPDNRILRQLAKCSLDYCCFTAQNIFYQRWEGGLPVSPACNAACLGCISLQESECCPSPQGRIAFRPNLDEAVRVAVTHLSSSTHVENAPRVSRRDSWALDGGDPIISFGQGCEGEPSLEADLIAQIIAQTRKTVTKGVFNINTNGGFTDGIVKIVDAGLNSARFSIISALPTDFCSYYRPKGYRLDDVGRSIDICMAHGVYVALNLLCLPGYTDRTDQMEALSVFLAKHPVNMIQLRNLNIDPDILPEQFRTGRVAGAGVGASAGAGASASGAAGFAALIERLTAIVGRDGIGNYTRVQTP